MKYVPLLNKPQIENLVITITRKCNLNCSYCIAKKKQKSISLCFVKKIINSFEKSIKNIIYFGGEPLLEKNKLKNIINYVNSKNKNIIQKIVTNGTIYNKKFFDFLRQKDVKIGVSLDGFQKSHDKNRKYKNNDGSYLIVKNNLNKMKPDAILFVLSKNTINDFSNNVKRLLSQNYKVKIDFQKWCKWEQNSVNKLKKEIKKLRYLIKQNKKYKRLLLISNINECRNKSICLFTDNKLYDCTDIPYLFENNKRIKHNLKTMKDLKIRTHMPRCNVCLMYDKNFNRLKDKDIKLNYKVKELFQNLCNP